MNCLITGGAGFIGGHLAERLLKEGHTVYAVDNFSTGSRQNIEKALSFPKFHFTEGDVIDSPEVEAMAAESDVIFHFAAVVGVDLVVREPVRTIMTNVNGSERMLGLAAKLHKKIVLASTSEVYGRSDKFEFSENDDLVIGPSTHSRWSYACSKLLDEFLLMAYHRNKGLDGFVTRFFNTVGPRQTGQYGMVVPRFVASALENKPLRVFGTGKQTRCFCHIYDVLRAVELLLEHPEASGRIFNIGSSESITMTELAEFTIQTLNSRSKIEFIPYDKAYEKGFEDMLHRRPDCSAVHDLTGWKAEIPLKQIILDVAESIRSTHRA